ncbi:putative transcriptional regulator [Alteracholeplasma palmae J233]|uniref:Putative transcriptional regulator n=1 Tax=Alteracholeplasma palmae (strain ATCC 49389 / J233) TaxID=1318466 RepID=U4KLB2_ALTPJ|nr:winged helix-turn-helix transcriptional regulator [Alteracholeplasma palmae]CCV64699.1 putative transcriptional regulator [Alteracholeplasma palmae J233]
MDKNHLFFKPTPLYKEYMILDTLQKTPDITQRELSHILNVAVSMINKYLESYEVKGYIKKEYKSSKTILYHITPEGIERKKLLNIRYLKASQIIYNQANVEVTSFLNQLVNNGYKDVLLYGSGDVAEIILNTLKLDLSINIKVLGIIDDNKDRQGSKLLEVPIIDISQIVNYPNDGIIVATYTHHKVISQNLIKQGFDKNKIINFFN